MKYNFLKTSDKKIKDKLVKEGLKLISEEDGVFVFLNNDALLFNDINKSKIQYSNILTF